MEPVISIREYVSTAKDGRKRYISCLKEGERINRGRLIMMNYLHTAKIPSLFHIHHINNDSLDDRLENLLLISESNHMKHHNPQDFKYGVSWRDDPMAYQKARRNSTPENKKIHYLDSRRYIEKNKEKTAQYMKEYGERNRERILKQKCKYYIKHKNLKGEENEIAIV